MELHAAEWELRPADHFLQGFWIDTGSRVEKDAGWMRIEWLVSERLELLVRLEGETVELYRDPRDGRLWEKFSAAPAMSDGGPPVLTVIDADEARRKFSWHD